MNLRALANRATRTVNPNVTAQLRASTGYATAASGKQEPTYADAAPVVLQAQALTKRDLDHLAGLNISDAVRPVYANRPLTGVDRAKGSGGDLIDMVDGTFLVTAVLEDWSATSGWCKAALTRQLTA
jgi:hypothetical protein